MLTFDDATHTYRYAGRVVPSVTQVLQPVNDLSMVPADVLASASAFGTAVHRACELDDKGTLNEGALSEALVPYLDGWRLFRAEHVTKWAGIEKQMFHTGMGYAGTADRLGHVDGDPAVLDIKGSVQLYPAVGPQLAAYARAWMPVTGSSLRRYGLRLFPGGYELKAYTDPTDWPLFCSLLTMRSWCQRHSITPKFNYQPKEEAHV